MTDKELLFVCVACYEWWWISKSELMTHESESPTNTCPYCEAEFCHACHENSQQHECVKEEMNEKKKSI